MALKNAERVEIWNAFFLTAWTTACDLAKTQGKAPALSNFRPAGGTLDPVATLTLLLLMHCTFAIEARANHLLEELAERGKIQAEEAVAFQHLNARRKWFMLPKLAGCRKRFDIAKHRPIARICDKRNDLMHVNFAQLKRKVPTAPDMLELFQGFVVAMEDMNVLLGRATKPRKRVLAVGDFR